MEATLTRSVRTRNLPETARRYLDHAIAPDAPPARAVGLRMHGEIRLRGWTAFEADEMIRAGRDLSWDARTTILGLPVTGFDRVVRGYGECQWKLFGWLPIASARGANVSRSAVGRMAAESVWLPSVLLDEGVRWSSSTTNEATFGLTLFGHTTEVTLSLASNGRIEALRLLRWGNPDGLPFGLYPFGGTVEEETTFDGFTIPSRLRLGWHFGANGFGPEGESFRATVDAAEFAASSG